MSQPAITTPAMDPLELTLLWHLENVLRKSRLDAGRTQDDVSAWFRAWKLGLPEGAARRVGGSVTNISNHENHYKANGEPVGWPRDPELLVRGYAAVSGREPAAIWGEALERWQGALEGQADEQQVAETALTPPQQVPRNKRPDAG